MAQRYDAQSGDQEDAERARLEQEELARQLQPGAASAPASAPAENPSSITSAESSPLAAPQDFGRLSAGYAADKLADPNKHDFKYDTARVMSRFDPKQGFTPDVINALNQLDYGTFSGSGDKLSLSGAKNAKDAADFANQDWIQALKAQNGDTKWNFGGGGAAPQEAPQAGAGPSMGAAAGGPSSFQGINSLVPTDTGFYNQLQAKLAEILGGNGAFDREALLAQLTGK